MVGAQRFLPDGEGALVERFGVAVAALVTIQPCEIIECRTDVGMIGTPRFFNDRDRALVERLGVAVAALILIQPCEVI